MQTYEEFINSILETRGRFNCGEEYHERHHILPKCIGGGDEEENLIDLFAREHFDAHRLLALENPDNEKLIYAWHMMSVMSKNEKRKYEITAEEYEEARIANAKMLSARMSGENNPMYGKSAMYGKHHTEETKQKLSESKKGERNPMYGMSGEKAPSYGKKWSEEMRMKFLAANSGEKHFMYGKNHSEETKRKMREFRLGFRQSEETKEKIRASRKDKKPVICITTGIIYQSISEASKETGISKQSISQCCNGIYKSAGKDIITGERLVWEFINPLDKTKLM